MKNKEEQRRNKEKNLEPCALKVALRPPGVLLVHLMCRVEDLQKTHESRTTSKHSDPFRATSPATGIVQQNDITENNVEHIF